MFSAHTENQGLGVLGTAEHCWRSLQNLENKENLPLVTDALKNMHLKVKRMDT